MAVSPLVVGCIAPISGSLSDRFGTRPMTAIGLGFIVVSYITISTLTVNTTPLGYALRYALMGVGVGMFQSPNNSAVMGAVPRDRLGVASGLLSITRTLGQVVGISLLGAMWSGFVAAQGGSADLIGGITSASPAAQTLALRQVLVYVVVLMILALLLSLWALWKERSSLTAKLQQGTAGQGDLR
jgi:MFS family permease